LNNGYIFSSEVRGLLSLADFPRELELSSIASHMQFIWNPSSKLPLKGVERLGPGEFLEFNNGILKNKGKWAKTFTPNKIVVKSSSELILDARNLLVCSVERQLISDVPVGSFLSGGLDPNTSAAPPNPLKDPDPV
jgi:asparagine synthase (glutamine-hydrolysing)